MFINIFRLIFFMCYCGIIGGIISGPVTHTGCKFGDQCVLLKNCKNFMNLIHPLEKPLTQHVVQYLRERQCGFQEGYPKVCCSDFFKVSATTPSSNLNYKKCNTDNICVLLKNCTLYMDLIGKIEKPLDPTVVEFLRSQQCGFLESYPAVCCDFIPDKIKRLEQSKPTSKPRVSRTGSQLHMQELYSKTETTTPYSKTSREMELQKKMDAINKHFDLVDYFDFTGTFDLLRRKRSNNNTVVDIEIR